MASELDRKRALSRCVLCVATVGAAAVTMVACGGTSSNLGSVSHPTLPSGLQSTPSGAPGPTSGNLGDTLTMVDAGEDVAHVTLVKVFDPASGFDPNTTPPDGTRWVGFEGTIVIDGSRAGEDSTSVDVIGSDGQTYGADTSYHLSVFDGCTATGIDVASGQTQTFCAGVGLPPGVTVVKVGYSTEGVDGNVPAKLFWTVAGPGQNAPSASTPTATPTVSAAPANSSTGSVGDTLTYTDSAGTATQVTLVQIFDPAQGVDSGSSPPDGTRWVGFEGKISGEGASDDAMTFDAVGSDGQTYGFNTSYHLGAFTGCTGTSNPAPTGPITFCAGVGLPPGVTVSKVGYSIEGVDVGGSPALFWSAS